MTDPHPSPPGSAGSGTRPTAGFGRVMGAVFAGFLGIRRKAAGERDMASIKPVHVVVGGLLGAAILIAALVALVTLITRGN